MSAGRAIASMVVETMVPLSDGWRRVRIDSCTSYVSALGEACALPQSMYRLRRVWPNRCRSFNDVLPMRCCEGSIVPTGIDSESYTHGSARHTLASAYATVALFALTVGAAPRVMSAGPAPAMLIVWLTFGPLVAGLLAQPAAAAIDAISTSFGVLRIACSCRGGCETIRFGGAYVQTVSRRPSSSRKDAVRIMIRSASIQRPSPPHVNNCTIA